jgi:hypothetical protein
MPMIAALAGAILLAPNCDITRTDGRRCLARRRSFRQRQKNAVSGDSGEAERGSGIGLKLLRFIAELVFAFIPECRSTSSRNRVHLAPDSPSLCNDEQNLECAASSE